MSRKVQQYEAPGLKVTFEPGRCIHAAECVRGLPRVFDPQRRPWVEPESAGRDEVVDVVRRCPTGALKYEVRDELAEPAATENTIQVRPRGPLFVRGDVELRLGDDSSREVRLALCRCGASRNKPFCDNSHREEGFGDDGSLSESRLKSDAESLEGLVLEVLPDGPILLSGSVQIEGTASEPQRGDKGALCRCGASQSKPYCDGSHKAVNFIAK